MLRLRVTQGCLGAIAFAGITIAEGQGGGATGSGPAMAPPGDIALLHFLNSNLAPMPVGSGGPGNPLQVVDGNLHVVDHQGQRMLRASARSTLRLSLPVALPRDFTIEIDLVPKTCCRPEDIAVEGTASINQGSASANILWARDAIQVVGGGGGFDRPVPEPLASALPGALTNVVYTFRGDELTVYTNGQLLYTIPNRLFVRGRVLRIFLGGQNDTDQAVYLARFRVAAGVQPPTASSSQGLMPTGVGTGAQPSGTAGSTAMAGFAGNVNVSPAPAGPLVRWTMTTAPSAYQVVRWKIDDPMCCAAASPLSTAIASWQDTPPPLPGTYVYQVTAFTTGGPFVAQGQFVYQGAGGQTITAPSGSGSVQPAASGTSPSPTVTPPRGAAAGTVPSGFTVAVASGSPGPVVTWNQLAGASGYRVTRAKIDDANCCNASSGTTPITGLSWQDQAPPMTGTYVYTVTATTAAGGVQGSAQLAYTAPLSVVPLGPISGTATATPISQPPSSGTTNPSSSGGTGGSTTTSGGPGLPDPCATQSSTTSSNTMTSASTATAGSAPPCAARFRVTITGFHVFRTTNEPVISPDGQGDEVYAAVATLQWNRNALTIGSRNVVKTREHGFLGTAGMYPNRVQAGTRTPTGGIWTGNGAEQVPSTYSPNGSTFPAPTNDRFPLLVWEGTLTDGADAILVAPTLWERDLDPMFYTTWERYWTGAPLASLFTHTAIDQLIRTPTLGYILNPATGAPLDVPLQDMMGNVRDRPLGTDPRPMPLPVIGRYEDRLVMLTREKLATLGVGAATMVTIQYAEPVTSFANAHYTLYLRVERLP